MFGIKDMLERKLLLAERAHKGPISPPGDEAFAQSSMGPPWIVTSEINLFGSAAHVADHPSRLITAQGPDVEARGSDFRMHGREMIRSRPGAAGDAPRHFALERLLIPRRSTFKIHNLSFLRLNALTS